ncbi:MAG: hypothetical protein C0514_05805 [Candidatus Puniceispirillum sp.]|nr:hypothetical protein [Candidatus Puniceispirillum sp.]
MYFYFFIMLKSFCTSLLCLLASMAGASQHDLLGEESAQRVGDTRFLDHLTWLDLDLGGDPFDGFYAGPRQATENAASLSNKTSSSALPLAGLGTSLPLKESLPSTLPKPSTARAHVSSWRPPYEGEPHSLQHTQPTPALAPVNKPVANDPRLSTISRPPSTKAKGKNHAPLPAITKTSRSISQKPSATISKDEALVFLNKGTHLLNLKIAHHLPEALEAFGACYRGHNAFKWEACMGAIETSMALNKTGVTHKYLSLMVKGSSCPLAFKADALTFSNTVTTCYLDLPPTQTAQPLVAPRMGETTHLFPINDAVQEPYGTSSTLQAAPMPLQQEAFGAPFPSSAAHNYLYLVPEPFHNTQAPCHPPLSFERPPVYNTMPEPPTPTSQTQAPYLLIESTMPAMQAPVSASLPPMTALESLIFTPSSNEQLHTIHAQGEANREGAQTDGEKHKPILTHEGARALFLKGTRFLDSGHKSDLLEAIKVFRACRDGHPSHVWDGCLGIAKAHLALDNRQKLLKHLKKIELNTTCPLDIKAGALRLSVRLNARILAATHSQKANALRKK